MTLDDWYGLAAADADRRQLPDLKPVLKGLHAAAATLRAASWNDEATGLAGAGAASASSASSASAASESSASDATPSSSSSPRASS